MDFMDKVGIIGAGAWGSALAFHASTRFREVVVWAYEREVVDEINHQHENRTYFPDIRLPDNIRATSSLSDCLQDAHMVFSVSPSYVFRSVMCGANEHIPRNVPIVSATKGIEADTLLTMSEVLQDILPPEYHKQIAVLSGPSFAREVAMKHPTAISVGSKNEQVAVEVQNALSDQVFRVYTSTDMIGMEIGGALKNVIAIASGAIDGLGFGSNTMAALITRGLAEITRLAVKKGANPLTMAGLSGMGDLVLTCMGGLSRNRQVGQKLGRGEKMRDILRGMRQVAEGVHTARSVQKISAQQGVEMPISEMVFRMLYEDLPAKQALEELMGRTLKKELHL